MAKTRQRSVDRLERKARLAQKRDRQRSDFDRRYVSDEEFDNNDLFDDIADELFNEEDHDY